MDARNSATRYALTSDCSRGQSTGTFDPLLKTLFARLEAEKVNLFYDKAPVEFGTVGASD